MPLLIHKEIYPRFETTGVALEKLHKQTRSTLKEIKEYFDGINNWIVKFKALNNSILEVEKMKDLNPQETERRKEAIFKIGDIFAGYVDVMEASTHDSKIKIDAIYAFGDTMKNATEELIKVKDNLSASEMILDEIEKEFKKHVENYNIVSSRIRLLKDGLEQQKKLYYSIVS